MNRLITPTLLFITACHVAPNVDELSRDDPRKVERAPTAARVFRAETLASPQPIPQRLDTPRCAPRGEDCYDANIACCRGTFCDLDVNAYGRGKCQQLLDDGEFCVDGLECASGVCADSNCAACLPREANCYTNPEGCCSGQFCDLSAGGYGFASCRPVLEPGEFCEVASQCASGDCQDDRCR